VELTWVLIIQGHNEVNIADMLAKFGTPDNEETMTGAT
jgi:hypothetical protein